MAAARINGRRQRWLVWGMRLGTFALFAVIWQLAVGANNLLIPTFT